MVCLNNQTDNSKQYNPKWETIKLVTIQRAATETFLVNKLWWKNEKITEKENSRRLFLNCPLHSIRDIITKLGCKLNAIFLGCHTSFQTMLHYKQIVNYRMYITVPKQFDIYKIMPSVDKYNLSLRDL